MMVTYFRCWWQNHYVGDFFRYVGDFLNILNRSLTSQTCHQHIWSPTSITNIDVTIYCKASCPMITSINLFQLMHLLFRCFDNRNLYFLFINIFLFIYFRKYLIFERFSIRISILFQRLIFCLERLSWHCFRFIGFLLYWIVRLVVLASRISCWDFSPSPAELLIQSPIICPIVKNWTKLKFHRTDTSQRITSGVKK